MVCDLCLHSMSVQCVSNMLFVALEQIFVRIKSFECV